MLEVRWFRTDKISIVDGAPMLELDEIFSGKKITSYVFPIIFDQESEEPGVKYRSVPFYKQVVKDPTMYHNLDPILKDYFIVGVRDLFYASQNNYLDEDEIALLKQLVEIIGDEFDIEMDGMSISPCPTKTKKSVRYVDYFRLQERVIQDPAYENLFLITKAGFVMIFVDQADLSYHNFENIINLDRFMSVGERPFLVTENIQRVGRENIYKFKIEDAYGHLSRLDGLNLYLNPTNDNARGGKRMIFLSRILGDAMTMMIQNGTDGTYELLKPNPFPVKNFKFVNNVFRLNKFSPGERKFISHYDTPYLDGANNHYSRYTMIIYLTGGKGTANAHPLRIGDVHFDKIEPMTGVIFSQDYEHEGNPYVDNDKIFIRTELIYKSKNALKKNDPKIAKMFNIACYATKESVFDPELKQYSSELFNQVAQLRYGLLSSLTPKFQTLHKKFKYFHYLTNGHDFLFPKFLDLKHCALITIIDYFNGYLYGKRNLIESEKIDLVLGTDESVAYLYGIYNQADLEDVALSGDSFADYFFESIKCKQKKVPKQCPEKCKHDGFSSYHCCLIVEAYNKRCNGYNGRFEPFSVAILNNSIKVNMDDMEIEDGKINFKTTGYHPRINFAACWEKPAEPKDYLKTDECHLEAFHLPEIEYHENELYFRLSIDLFHGGFQFTKLLQFDSDEFGSIEEKIYKPEFYEPGEIGKKTIRIY